MNFEESWTMQNSYYRVCATVRVTIQRRAVNTYTFIEDLIADGDVKHWKIRRGSVKAHGRGYREGFIDAAERAKALWCAETRTNPFTSVGAS